MRKELVVKAKMSGREQRDLATKSIAVKLMNIMTKHIGNVNGITRSDLFKKLFGMKYNDDNLKHYIYWDFVKKAMHLLRTRSNCFVASSRDGRTDFKYFVIESGLDAKLYIDNLENNIKRMKLMQKRASRSVVEGWHRQIWEIQPKRQLK